MPVDVLYDDVANLDAGASDQDALNATGLNYSFLPAGPHVFLNMEGYDVSSATSSYWSMWINGVDYGFNFANFGTSNLSDGDVVEFLYTNGTLNATTARATIEVNITESSSSSPTYTRTLESTTVSAGDTVHVRLDLDLDVAGTLAGMCERYDRTTSNVNWTITNIESSPEFTTLVLKNNTGEYDIGVGFTTLPAGTYYAEYDLMINPETPAGTYDLTGFYQDSNNIDPTIDAIGDTQLTVTMPVDVLYDDVANLDAGASDQDALNATGLNYSFLPAGPHVFLNMEGYDVSSATSSYWSMWINGVDYGFNFANFGTNNLSDGDVVEFLYTNGTLNAATARVTIEANMDAIDTPTLSFDSASSSVIEGQETEIGIIADILPDGLSGYNLTVTLDDPSVAEIVGISYPSWVNITENSSLPGSSVYLTALDGNDVIQAGAEDVVLATLTVSGKDVGLANLSIEVTRMDDDAGYQIEPTLTTGEVEVTLFTLPDQENSARDLDGDGLYEDLTGNGEFSFVDIVVYFHNIEWIDENLPTEYFDFNDNGRIDFDDIVDMFQILE
jgi:PKD repeat protein